MGVALGLAAGFIPGFSSNNVSMLFVTYSLAYGLMSADYRLAVVAVAIEISYSFFGFLSPIIFGIGSEDTALAVGSAGPVGSTPAGLMPADPVYAGLAAESFKRSMNIVASGGLVGVLISLPLLFFAEKIYPVVYGSLKPLAGWILLLLCAYMVWAERGWKKKAFAAAVLLLSGMLGLLTRDSGLVPSEYLLLPIFVGLYGFGSLVGPLVSGRRERDRDKVKDTLVQRMTWTEKARAAAVAFISAMFATLVPGMKRGQASAIALQVGGFSGREGVLFVLPAVSMAFATLSIFVLGSTGRVRSSMAYDVQQIVGDLYFSQTVLFAGAVAIAACMSACILIILAKPIGRLLSRADGKYIKLFGFCVCSFLIVNFTGLYGVLMAFAATCIGLLSSRLGTRSVHLMGVLLVPSIVAALMA